MMEQQKEELKECTSLFDKYYISILTMKIRQNIAMS
jgi:hypothetical protein